MTSGRVLCSATLAGGYSPMPCSSPPPATPHHALPCAPLTCRYCSPCYCRAPHSPAATAPPATATRPTQLPLLLPLLLPAGGLLLPPCHLHCGAQQRVSTMYCCMPRMSWLTRICPWCHGGLGSAPGVMVDAARPNIIMQPCWPCSHACLGGADLLVELMIVGGQ